MKYVSIIRYDIDCEEYVCGKCTHHDMAPNTAAEHCYFFHTDLDPARSLLLTNKGAYDYRDYMRIDEEGNEQSEWYRCEKCKETFLMGDIL